MKPFVLVIVEGGNVQDTRVVGDSYVTVIVVDKDNTDIDARDAEYAIEEILGQYEPGEEPETYVQEVLDDLSESIDDEYDEDDEEDPEVAYFLDNHGQGSDEDDDKKDEDYAPGDFTADQKPEYNGNTLIGGEPTPLDPRD